MKIRKWLLGYFALTSICDIVLPILDLLFQSGWQNYIATPLYALKELLSVGIFIDAPVLILLALLPMLTVGTVSIAGLLVNDRWIKFVWQIVAAHMSVTLFGVLVDSIGVYLSVIAVLVVIVALLTSTRWLKRIWQIVALLTGVGLVALIGCILNEQSHALSNVLLVSVAIDVVVWILGHNARIKE